MNRHKAYWLTVMPSLLLSPIAHADIVGSLPGKGTEITTFTSKPYQLVTATANNLDETWVFNDNQTLTRGTLTGTLKQKRYYPKIVDVVYDKTDYINHLSDFWTNLGHTVNNIRILENKLQIRQISNGLIGEEKLKYKVNFTETSSIRSITVVKNGQFFMPADQSEYAAIFDMFPTQSAGSSSQVYSISALTTTQIANITTNPISALTSDQISHITTNPISALTSTQISNLTTSPISALTSTQISNLTTIPISALTSTQISHLTTSPISALPSLPTTAIPALGQ